MDHNNNYYNKGWFTILMLPCVVLRRVYDQQNLIFSGKFLWPGTRMQHKEHKDRIQIYSTVSLHCVKHQRMHGWCNTMQVVLNARPCIMLWTGINTRPYIVFHCQCIKDRCNANIGSDSTLVFFVLIVSFYLVVKIWLRARYYCWSYNSLQGLASILWTMYPLPSNFLQEVIVLL